MEKKTVFTREDYNKLSEQLNKLKTEGRDEIAEKIKEALWNVDYTGVTGQIKFDSVNGDAQRTVAYIKAADTATGAWKFVKEQGV